MSSTHGGSAVLAGMLSTVARSVNDTLPSPAPTPILAAAEVDSDNCKLMGPFALFVQTIMGILVIGSLVYKRQREKPKRKWKIWALDVSKQLLGQLFVHILNVVLSDFVASGGGKNPCSLYFLNILVDTTVGVFFIYIALKYVTWFLTERLGLEGFVSGQYTPPPLQQALPTSGSAASSVASGASRRSYRRGRPRIEYWLKQLGSYLFVLFLMKMAVLVIFAIFPFLFDIGSWILGLFGSHNDFQVLFSMALFPLAMNVLQFWLIDSLLRHNPYTSAYAKVNPDDESFLHDSNRVSTDSRFSDSHPGVESHAQTHSIGVDSDDDADDHKNLHALGSASSSRRRSSPSGTSRSRTDQPYDYPPPAEIQGAVAKTPGRPLDEMRRQASLTLSDHGSDQEAGAESIHQAMSNSKASLRSESHHLKQVSGDPNES